jgi:hypothetical protein
MLGSCLAGYKMYFYCILEFKLLVIVRVLPSVIVVTTVVTIIIAIILFYFFGGEELVAEIQVRSMLVWNNLSVS